MNIFEMSTNRQSALEEFEKSLLTFSGSASIDSIIERLKKVNNEITTKGIVFNEESARYLMTENGYGQIYDWDLYFESIYAMYNGESKFCFANLEAFFERQEEDGFIARAFGLMPYGKKDPFKPFIAQITLLGCLQVNDFTWARKHFINIERYLNSYYTRYDNDNNGLCFWIEAGASGMDNQHSRVPIDGTGEGVDLNCYLYRDYLALAKIAEKLGLIDKKEIFIKKTDEIKANINKYLWDEKTGFYYDRSEVTGDLIFEKGVSGFVPLWAGIASEEQAKRLVFEHLLNENEFWTNYPIATLSCQSKAYDQSWPLNTCSWNGPVWIPMNYMIFHGLVSYGFFDVAKILADKSFELVYIKNSSTREFYNGDDGTGYGIDPFLGWTTLAYYMPFEFHMNYDPTNIDNEYVIPLGSMLGLNLYNK